MITELLSGYGLIGIFVLGILEAMFLPVPVETLIIPYLMMNKKMIVFAIIASTGGSVIGALINHYIGKVAGKRVIYKYIKNDKSDMIHKLFNKYGVYAVAIAALTPLPYKIFALISGILGMERKKLALTALISRGFRFTAVGILTIKYGDAFMKTVKSMSVDQKILVFLVLIIIVYIMGNIFSKKKER
ncbi:VTT domain-containing protein [Clostridiaceae bacterium M8S5]|nr:VTT domain-containing protein [Clostridiaceae bacterium M8S5]